MLRSENLLLVIVALGAIHVGFAFVGHRSLLARRSNIPSSTNTFVGGDDITARRTSLFTADTPYLRTTGLSDDLVAKFQSLRKAFPKNADVVKAGGWHNLERLSVDPKQEMVSLIVEGLKSTDDSKIQFGSSYDDRDDEKLEALLLLLYGMGKGFEADVIDGEWDLVFSKQGKKSPAFQKLVGTAETAKRSKNVFDIASMTFSGTVRFWRWGMVGTKVKYETSSEAFSLSSNGKIVLRRIVCTIVNAFFKWWKLPGIPFPLPKRKGYLDVIYLDDDIRVTKGNRGGLFVHFRPSYLDKVMAD
jgi:hypothetical protein